MNKISKVINLCEWHKDKEKVRIGHNIRLIDSCLVSTVNEINSSNSFRTLAHCCGHGKYHKSIIVTNKVNKSVVFEYFTKLILTKQSHFYKLDKSTGLYYIPELEAHYREEN